MCDNRCQRASTHHARKTADKPNKKKKKKKKKQGLRFLLSFHLDNITSVRYRCSPSGLTLNRTQVLRSASKFAPGHRVERLAPFWVPNRTGPRPASPAPSYCPKPELMRLWCVASARTRSAQWRQRSSSRFSPRSERRARGGMGERRHRPPRRPWPRPPRVTGSADTDFCHFLKPFLPRAPLAVLLVLHSFK